MYCKKCGRIVNPGAKFCSNCGAEIPEEKIEFNFAKPEEPKETEKRRVNISKENFNWDLEGFPSAGNSKTEEVNFNWDSVLDKKKRDEVAYNQPISFSSETEKKEKHEEAEKAAEEIKAEPVPEKYQLSDLFGDDVEENSDDGDETESEEIEKNDDDIMELSFEDEIFGDLKDEKPASATIRISQTIHFTDQLYSFDNKQAEYQSILDAEYEKLQNEEGEEEEEGTEPVPEVSEDEVAKDGAAEEAGEDKTEEIQSPEFNDETVMVTGIKSDDFLKELYGMEEAEAEEKETNEPVSDEEPESLLTEEAEEAEDYETEENVKEEISAEVSQEEETEEKSDEEPEAAEQEEACQEDAEDITEEEETEEEEEVNESESEEVEEPEDVVKIIENEEPEEEEKEEDSEADVNMEEEEAVYAESVPEDGMECVGVALARTPRGVLVIQKNNKEKLTRRTIFPSKEESAENEELKAGEEAKESKETDDNTIVFKPETEKNERLSFGDVFNNDDDDDDDDNNIKPEKKGKALKVIAVILVILIIGELSFIGIQYFAPESSAAKKLNSIYNNVLGKITGNEVTEEELDVEDLIVSSPLDEYVLSQAGRYKNIAEVRTDTDLKFAEGKQYELEGFGDSGVFADSQWYTDNDGNSIMYSQAIVDAVCGYFEKFTEYKGGDNNDVMNFVTENSALAEDLRKLESDEDAEYAVNSLVLGDVRTSEKGIYVAASVEETNSKSDKPENSSIVLFLKPVGQELKVDNIVLL